MKKSGQNMKVTLPINGRERTFSRQELIEIVEKHFNEATEKTTQKPTEGEWFEVDPMNIDQGLFEKRRKDNEQEKTRRCILEAFREMNRQPEKYGKKFETMMPKKDWSTKKTVLELETLASKLGERTADWVEQALEWAQRIHNGEPWGVICNEPDTANWKRLIICKCGAAKVIGSSRCRKILLPASYDPYVCYALDVKFDDVVPLVVRYE